MAVDVGTTREDLLRELERLRQRLAELEATTAERSRAEDALRESETRLREVFEHSQDVLYKRNLQTGQYEYMSPAIVSITGYAPDEVLAMSPEEVDSLVHPEDIGRINDLRRKQLGAPHAYEPETASPAEYRVKCRDGTYRWLSDHFALLNGPEGRPLYSVASVRDITERKRAEEALRESERRYRDLVENANDIVYTHDLEGSFTSANPTATRVFGYTIDEILQLNISEVVHPESLPLARAKIQEKLEGAPRSGPYELLTYSKDGQPIWVEVSTRLIEAEGSPVGVAGLARDVTERKRAEEALRESEERFRRLSEASFEGVVIHEQGKIIDVNRAFARMFGYDPLELMERDALDFATPELRELALDHMRTGSTERYDGLAIRKDGSMFPVEVQGRRMPYKGRMVRVVAVRDIAERKLAEEALRESEQRYRTLFERVPVGLYRTTPGGQILEANPAMVEMFGHADRESLLACNAVDIFAYPDERRHELSVLDEAGVLRRYEAQMRRRDGTLIWVQDTARAIRDPDGRVLHYEGNLEDVTERKRAEEALRESEERFRQFFENEPEYCYMISPEGEILDVNRSALEVLGYRKEELVGKPVRTIYAPESLPRVRELFPKWQETRDLRDEEIVIVTREGERRTVLLSASAVSDSEGRVLHSVSIQRDITERRELEERLQRAARLEAVGQLAAGVAHQFNNLMTVVNGYSEFVMNALGPHHPMWKDVNEVLQAGNRAAKLTSQLLSFGRRQMLQMQVVDLTEVLEGMRSYLESVVREDICLELKLGSGLGRVRIDPGHMEQVLMGMVTNSCEAMPAGGVLAIETANAELDAAYAATHEEVKPGQYVMLAITDTGVGMTPEVKAHIFEPFFTTKGMAVGTGLGLAAVYGMVKQIGGSIYVHSEPGQGTTFKIYLPRVDEAPDVEEPGRPAIEAPGGTETILVVVDNEGVRRLAVNLLGRLGYKVLEAAGGREALDLCRTSRERIDLVLTDVVMPDMNGSQLVERLGDVRPGIKALHMPGHPDEVITYHGVRVPESRLVQRPFNIQELAGNLREALEEG